MDKEETLELLELMRECRDRLDDCLTTETYGTTEYDDTRDLMYRMYEMEKVIRENHNIPPLPPTPRK